MQEKDVASSLHALGHEARLHIFRLLVQAEPGGLTIGEIGELSGVGGSTLAHHLKSLVAVGLVSQKRQGRAVINRVNFEKMNAVLGYVASECCQGLTLNQR
jgi:DNA-binding transcriptional ArsR family regulator